MSSLNYSLKHKGVKLIPSEKAWVKTKKARQGGYYRTFGE